jgi:hypothetical protein
LTGLTGAARQQRISEIMRERELGTFQPLPSDLGVKTKRSKWAVRFEREYGQRPRGVSDVARLTGIDRRRLSFKIKVFDDVEQVGEAEHDRFIVDLDKYQAKLKKKIEG